MNSSEQDAIPGRPTDLEAMNSQRQAGLSELARGMGHDFNNHLQGILGALSVVKLSTPPGHQLHGILDLAERSANQARELGRRLIFLAKGKCLLAPSGPLGPVLKAAVEEAFRDTAISCQCDLAGAGLEVQFDEQAIRLLVDILACNAREAMPGGGALVLTASRCDLPADPAQGLAAGAYVRHTFKDSGHGIAPEVLPQIFDRYFTTKDGKSQKGVGLSLAIAQAIAWGHGGALLAEPGPGPGATFHLLLPAS